MTAKKAKPVSISSLSAELEAITLRLQEHELPLEEAISEFERATVLCKDIQERLEAAEQKVKMLSPAESMHDTYAEKP